MDQPHPPNSMASKLAPLDQPDVRVADALLRMHGKGSVTASYASEAARAAAMPASGHIAQALEAIVADKSKTLAAIYRQDDPFGLGTMLMRCCAVHATTPQLWNCHRVVCTELLGHPVFEICKAVLARHEAEGAPLPQAIKRYGKVSSPWELLLLDHMSEMDRDHARQLASMLERSGPAPILDATRLWPCDDSAQPHEAERGLEALLGAIEGAPSLGKMRRLATHVKDLALLSQWADGHGGDLATRIIQTALRHGMPLPPASEIDELDPGPWKTVVESHALAQELAASTPLAPSPQDAGRPRI